MPDGGYNHRNVIFKNNTVPEKAFSLFDAHTALDLWKKLLSSCNYPCEFMTIPREQMKGFFEEDPDTDVILMMGEIGGPQEVDAGQFAKENMKKPVVAYIAGLTAPKGRVMGHAGAIVSAYGESAVEKVELLKECGVTISKNPSVIGDTIKSVLS